jgi:hypothetical protein
MKEIESFGTGVRGVFKLDKSPEYKPTKVNYEVLDKPVERGVWVWDMTKACLKAFTGTVKKQVHYIQTDTIEAIESLATLPHERPFITESRSALDRHYKERGVERTSKKELLNQKQPKHEFNPMEHKDQWERAEADVKYGKVELTEKEKEICRQENEILKKYKKGYRSDFLDKKLNQN